ncbi:biotin--[acetyl-CoA-carboxylase] ligase [Fodinisporobacter ferrooxydans]|uniref:biotin--[biotin carboxyl-carrier protein] ligase n=1 Tax=Fodinisporobacter ferrooxydans TaxID=2901836 RepID=A0ABY4CH00_9BACL|nr:biotin--[acetyl-CoA-carboxylase] ligase [Alicyclobacillaceae bacterium MYW30-H2]
MEPYSHDTVRAAGPFQIFQFGTVHSTNTLALERLQSMDVPEFTVFLADRQTEGRGRQGKHWDSPKAAGVWMSIVVHPYLPLSVASQLTLVTAIAVRRGLAHLTGSSPNIKWPNDIFYGNRKVCGILTETTVREKQVKSAVIGIGVNVNILPNEFPSYLQKTSTSLLAVTGKEWDRDRVADAILKEFADCYRQFLTERSFAKFRQEWETFNHTLGKTVQVNYNHAQISGVATGIDPDGCLIIQKNDGETIRIHSGELQMLTSS